MKISLTFSELTEAQARQFLAKAADIKGLDFAEDDYEPEEDQEGEQTPDPGPQRNITPKMIPGDGLDKDGVPWTEDIHAGSKTKTAKGYWKRRKGIQPVEYDRRIAELKAEKRDRVIATAPAAIAAAVARTPDPMAPYQTAPVANIPAPPAPAVYAPPAPPAPTAPAIQRDYAGLMQHISNLFSTKQIQPDYPPTVLERVNTGFGVTLQAITDIAHDPRMVDYAWQCLEIDGKGLR